MLLNQNLTKREKSDKSYLLITTTATVLLLFEGENYDGGSVNK